LREFVEDLYATFLLLAPDAGGFANWVSTLQNFTNNGQNGRAHVIQGFAYSVEFGNLINGLTDTPPPDPVCNPVDEQSC